MEMTIRIAASPDTVWRHLADFEAHSEWMTDAESVVIDGDQRTGVGTRMTVPTRVGPFTTTDVMTVVQWEEGRRIVARHEGVVTGTGSFAIKPDGAVTRLTWSEDLRFPWWMGGRLGHFFAQPILRRIWNGNLDRLRRMLETG
jgi:carbon monoxide dehydrogenase subunit G